MPWCSQHGQRSRVALPSFALYQGTSLSGLQNQWPTSSHRCSGLPYLDLAWVSKQKFKRALARGVEPTAKQESAVSCFCQAFYCGHWHSTSAPCENGSRYQRPDSIPYIRRRSITENPTPVNSGAGGGVGRTSGVPRGIRLSGPTGAELCSSQQLKPKPWSLGLLRSWGGPQARGIRLSRHP